MRGRGVEKSHGKASREGLPGLAFSKTRDWLDLEAGLGGGKI